MRQKKGAVELQFNWIFVLVAGGLILTLVVGFVFRWMHQSEEKNAIETLRNLELIITASGVVEGGREQIDMYGLTMTYDGLTLKFKGVGIPGWRMRSLFVPPKLKGEKMIIWTDSWFMPFYVGNPVYITTDQARYLAVFNDSQKSLQLERMLKEMLPAEVSIDYVNESQYTLVRDYNNYYVVSIFLETSLQPPRPLKAVQNAVVVTMADDNASGLLKFYSKRGSVWNPAGNSVWVQPEMLAGAVVTGDAGLYNSTFSFHKERLSIIAGLLLEKVHQLMVHFPS